MAREPSEIIRGARALPSGVLDPRLLVILLIKLNDTVVAWKSMKLRGRDLGVICCKWAIGLESEDLC